MLGKGVLKAQVLELARLDGRNVGRRVLAMGTRWTVQQTDSPGPEDPRENLSTGALG